MSEDKYTKSINERDKHTGAVLSSTSKKKVVVAGPGTGKTFLFTQVLKEKPKSITLTFINALVEDLSLELFGQSEVKTLHGFARGILGDNAEIFSKLPKVIFTDGQILLGEKIEFEKILNTKDDKNKHLEFYSKRRKYYGKYFGFTDIVYALTKYFEENPTKVPSFQQVIIDEFQDFNKLEVSLVDLLATKSPILIAGDDDQALYDFKHADPKHIRDKHATEKDYESFNLPLCSRCPRVVVEATNDIVENAVKRKLLNGRIEKPYKYFDDEKKDKISSKYSKIIYTKKYDGQLGWYIEKEIENIARHLKGHFSVLVISPLKSQAIKIGKKLVNTGMEKIEYPNERKDVLSIIDGLKFLLEDAHSNLGWRIVAESLLSEDELKVVLEKSNTVDSPKIETLLTKKLIKNVNENLKILKKINKDASVSEEEIANLSTFLSLNQVDLMKNYIKVDLMQVDLESKSCHPAIKQVSVKTTTIQGSKGLSADYVFITHFDDQYFLEDKSSLCDKDIYKLLVALTRAKSKVYLISTHSSKDSTLLGLINIEKIESV